MPAGEAPLVLALAQRPVQAGQDRGFLGVQDEVVPVEQQAAGAEHGGELGVHGAQLGLGEPVQRGGTHRGVRRTGAQAQPRGPAGNAQVQVGEAQSGHVRVGRPAQGQRHRIGVDADDPGARQPGEQPDPQRTGPAADVEDERVGPSGPLLDRVDERGEPVLAVRQALFLLAVPALDPFPGGVAVEFGHVLASPADCYWLNYL